MSLSSMMMNLNCSCAFIHDEMRDPYLITFLLINFCIDHILPSYKSLCDCALQASADYVSRERNVVFQNLKDTAVKSECCGHLSVLEKKLLSAPVPTAKKESMTYAIVTNIIEYTGLPLSNRLSNFNPKGKRGSRKVKLLGDGNVVKKHEEIISAETPLKKVRAY